MRVVAGLSTTSHEVVGSYVRQKAMIMTKTIGAKGAGRGSANVRVSNNDALGQILETCRADPKLKLLSSRYYKTQWLHKVAGTDIFLIHGVKC